LNLNRSFSVSFSANCGAVVTNFKLCVEFFSSEEGILRNRKKKRKKNENTLSERTVSFNWCFGAFVLAILQYTKGKERGTNEKRKKKKRRINETNRKQRVQNTRCP
jgi:hypothetical protein